MSRTSTIRPIDCIAPVESGIVRVLGGHRSHRAEEEQNQKHNKDSTKHCDFPFSQKR